ncbi:hypothetical protein [Aquirufa sp.]|jgi:hypothetical protein|uniref:hypothetical protein n=1 Tax=Aquirufa sp. TaxID=2676249 RepID=UPI003784F752
MRIFATLALLLFISVSCTNQPDLTGFDVEAFKNDRGSCAGTREKQIDWLKTHKMTWKGVSSNDLEDILGKPDIQQLADRNQEYYIYYLEKGPHCEKIESPSTARTMAFRFSAMGLTTEITFQQGLP